VRRSTKTLLAALAVLAIVASACGSDKKTSTTAQPTDTATKPADAPAVKIGAQDFGESAILSEIYKQGLEAKGYKVSIQKLGGFRPLELTAFDGATINFAAEYAASMLEALNGKKGEATGDVKATTTKLQSYLDAKKLVALEASAAVDTNAFVVTKATADKYGLKSLSDLASKGAGLVLGAPSDCLTNPFCIPGLKSKYGLDLSAKAKSLAPDQIAPALDAGQIDVALLFSTDSRIKTKGYVLLTDDKSMLAADNVVPVVSSELAKVSDLTKVTNAISAKLTTDKLIELNERYDVKKEDAAVIAKDFLKAAGLV
jgi:osmoprotectant transport system substrate-binding protein